MIGAGRRTLVPPFGGYYSPYTNTVFRHWQRKCEVYMRRWCHEAVIQMACVSPLRVGVRGLYTFEQVAVVNGT